MSCGIYMDVNVPAAITRALRQHGSQVFTAQEDGAARRADPDLLDRATELGCLMFTLDRDFLIEAARRQRAGVPFASVVFTHGLEADGGQCIEDLKLLASASTQEEMRGRVVYLPL